MIYTIGYGSRAKEELIDLLKMNGIELVIDIRRWPTSKLEFYKKENLSKILKEHGIEYVWLGYELGGFRKGGYGEYMKKDEFRSGIEALMSLASSKRVCLMCREVSPRGCHRRLIASHLLERGIRTAHIISKEKFIYEEGSSK
ncbi:MAG: DUF488 domain-containing protein [Nitrososphaerota archaeon]